MMKISFQESMGVHGVMSFKMCCYW